IYAPIFIISMTIILSNNIFTKLKEVLISIGNNSTNIWLIHSFFCYHWCQRFIFMPKLSVLIFLLLLVVSYISSIIINKFYKFIGGLYGTQNASS
ncbi:MAG: acyltransferase, partial [bacterium]|nr:acyltransferase [bacterium]